jgi:addiction module RelB/DinJ family antitoxin
MAKEATLQIRMDADLKDKAETLYRSLGTSLAEAVRIFARQSVQENGMPFVVTANRTNTYGRLARYADARLRSAEEGFLEQALVEKHEKAD